MKTMGIILIVVGIFMMIFPGLTFTQKKKVVDLGPVEVNKNEKKSIGWPLYAGAIVTAAGVLVTLRSGKKV